MIILQAWDQNVFNEVAHDGLLPFQSPPDQERLVYAANRTMLVRCAGLEGGGWGAAGVIGDGSQHLCQQPVPSTRPPLPLPFPARLAPPGGRAARGLLCQWPHLFCAAPV